MATPETTGSGATPPWPKSVASPRRDPVRRDSFPDRTAIEDAARMGGGHDDDTGSYISPPPFALWPRFDWLGWTLIALLASAGALGIWMGLR